MGRSERKEREWDLLCRKYERAGGNMSAFCRVEGVTYWQFRYRWRRYIGATRAERLPRPVECFVEVSPPSSGPSSEEYRLVLRSGRELVVSSRFSKEAVVRLIEVGESC